MRSPRLVTLQGLQMEGAREAPPGRGQCKLPIPPTKKIIAIIFFGKVQGTRPWHTRPYNKYATGLIRFGIGEYITISENNRHLECTD